MAWPAGAKTRLVVLRGHGVPALVGFTIAGALLQLLGPSTIPLPAVLADTSVRTPIGTLCCALFGIAIGQVCLEAIPALRVTSDRGWTGGRFGRALVALVLVTAIAAVSAPDGQAAKMASGTLLFACEAFVMASLTTPAYVWVLPIGHTLAGLTFGSSSDGSPQTWAWFVGSTASAAEIYLPAIAAVLAALAWAASRPREDGELVE